MQCRRVGIACFLRTVAIYLLIMCNASSVSAATRKEIGFRRLGSCRTTVQGRYLLSDDNGHVCNSLSIDPVTRCCPDIREQFSCQGCDLNTRCCNSYEYCVSCCLNPTRTRKEDIIQVKIARTATAGTYVSVFEFCRERCRHNSESVVHENAYISDFHHCFSLPTNASAWANKTQLESRLYGINIVVGRQGESCDSVCKLSGQTCVMNKLPLINDCDVLQRYMGCKGACTVSIGPDQPAEVVNDAPSHLNPGACLYTRSQSILSCDGSHPYTRRLCPCA